MARILLAEDEAGVREFVRRALAHHGHEVVAVADGLEALRELAAADGAARFDLLLTDIVMPQMDGIALALKAARDWPGTRILLMTGYAEQKTRAHNLEALIQDVVSKPFTMDEIARKVADALSPPSPQAGEG